MRRKVPVGLLAAPLARLLVAYLGALAILPVWPAQRLSGGEAAGIP